MHRHGYQGRKFHRERDQRRALMKGLADSLVLNEKIETTLPKAKELRPYVEKLVTKAKKGDLHNRRHIMSKLQTVEAAHKLVDEIALKMKDREGGYLRIERTTFRRGDNAEMATISFVDEPKDSQAIDKTVKSDSKAKDAADVKEAKSIVKKASPKAAKKETGK